MGKSIHIAAAGNTSSSSSSTANSTQYWVPIGGPTVSTTEANTQQTAYTAGTYSSLSVKLTANSVNTGTITFRYRKAATSGSQVVSIAAGATGNFIDSVNSDAVTVNDLFNIMSVMPAGSTGTVTPKILAMVFDTNSTSDTLSKLVVANATANSTTFVTSLGGSFYIPLLGILLPSGTALTEVQAQTVQRDAASFKNLTCRVTSNSGGSTHTITLRKNTANATQTISIAASSTGIFRDSTHTDTVVAGDKVCILDSAGAGSQSAHTVSYFQVEYHTSTSPGTAHYSLGMMNSTALTLAANNTVYFNIAGDLNSFPSASQASSQLSLPILNTSFHDLSVVISANTVTAASTVTFQKGGTDTILSASITASTTGTFTDSTNTVAATSGDLVNIEFTTGATGTSLTYSSISLFGDFLVSIDTTVTAKAVTNKFIIKA